MRYSHVKDICYVRVFLVMNVNRNVVSIFILMFAHNGISTKVVNINHRDDALETLLMSVIYEGRMHTFHPVTHLERTGVTQIRPLVYLSEKQAISAVRRLDLPVVESPCPVNGATRREDMKIILDDICKKIPKAREQMLSALMNHEKYSLWSPGASVQDDED